MVQLLGYGSFVPSKSYMPYFGGQREHQMRASLLGVWNNECQKCHMGVDFYDADLHHLNPKEKRFTLDQGTIGLIS